jgi:ABC-type dipeptide/oligopeptide/nickel transport system ATPase component
LIEITGKAGSGKSYLIKPLMETLQNTTKKYFSTPLPLFISIIFSATTHNKRCNLKPWKNFIRIIINNIARAEI